MGAVVGTDSPDDSTVTVKGISRLATNGIEELALCWAGVNNLALAVSTLGIRESDSRDPPMIIIHILGSVTTTVDSDEVSGRRVIPIQRGLVSDIGMPGETAIRRVLIGGLVPGRRCDFADETGFYLEI
jgi:hypothetical protein